MWVKQTSAGGSDASNAVWKTFSDAFQGDPAALSLLNSITFLTNVWDDLIDKDYGKVSDADVNKAFWTALIEIPENAFYARNHSRLSPLLRIGIQNWLAANKFERSGDQKLIDIAHVARYSIGDVVIEMLLIVGGYEWASHWTPILKPLIAPETREHYLEGLQKNAN